MKKARILVVEDESIIALDIMTNLAGLGFEVPDTAMTAADAVKKAEELLPDLILMDIQLKGDTDGIEAARIIRDKHNIPIVYMTGNADLATVNRARTTEPYGYIIKPVNLQDLFSTIDTALQRNSYNEEIRKKNIEFAAVNEELQQALEEIESTNEELSASMEEQQATNEQLIISNEELASAQKDILESNRMLAKGEQRFRGLFESMTEGVAIHELVFDSKNNPVDYRIIDTNVAYESHTGLNRDAVRGRLGTDVYGSEIPPYFDLFSRVAMTGVPEKYESFYPPMNRYFKITVFSPGKNLFATVFEDITTGKQMEEILKISQYTVDNANDSILRILPDGTILYANNATTLMTGISIEKLVSAKVWDFYKSINQTEWESHWQRLKREVSVKYETEYEYGNGKILLLEITDKYLSYGNLEFVLRNARDITLHRKTERKAKKLRGDLEDFFTLSLGLFCIADTAANFIRVNPSWERVLGYTAEELIGAKFTDFIHPDDLQATYDVMKDLSENREAIDFVNRYRHKDGSYRWLEWRSFPRGSLIYAVAHDVTERNLAEEQLRLSEEKFKKAFYTSPDSININRLSDGVYLEINQGFTRITGYTIEDVIGRSSMPGDLDIWVNAEDRSRLVRGLEEKGEVKDLEAQFRRKDGTELTGLMSAGIIEIKGERYLISITRDISDRKKLEETQHKIAKEWQATFDSVSDMIWLLDPEGMIMRSNAASVRFLGKTPVEITGEFCCKMMHDSAKPVSDCPIDRMKKMRKRETVEQFCREKWMNVSVDPIFGDDGSLLGIVHIVSDITQRKEYERELATNHDRFVRAQTIGHIGIWEYDIVNSKIIGSEELYKIFGIEFPAGNINNEKFFECLVERDRILSELRDRVNSGKAFEISFAINPADGAPRRIIGCGAETFRDKKDNSLMIVGYVQDITERKKAEELLRESEEKLHFMADNSADIIWHADSNLIITFVTPAVEKLLGFSVKEIVGKSLLDLIEPDTKNFILQEYAKLTSQESMEEKTAVRRYEMQMMKRDETLVWFEVNVNPYCNREGEFSGYYGISRDISERKKAEQIMKSSLLEKEILIKEVHHRVKNNLQMINSLINLQSSGIDNRIVKEKFITLQSRIRSMAIVHERLYKSEDLGKINFEEYINIIVHELSGNYAMAKKINGVKVNTQKIYLDIDRAIPCGLILNELMTNIYKYAFPDDWKGTPDVSVDLSMGENDRVVLSVSDNGAGFPVDEKMSSVSTLGLTLVKMLTAQLQGDFQIITRNGTRFVISFPANQDGVTPSS